MGLVGLTVQIAAAAANSGTLHAMPSPVPPRAHEPVALTRAEPRDWQRLRDVRLTALAESPQMFGSTWEKESAFDEGEWQRRAARPATFLASRDGVDIGIAGVYEFDAGWCVMGMWLAPVARGTGVVEALIEACESVAEGAGATTIALWVAEDNPRGQRAYHRLGYALTGAREQGRDGREELLMAKTLPLSR